MFATFVVFVPLLTQILEAAEPNIIEQGPLGQTFNIPKMDLLSSTLAPDGTKIAEPFPENCMQDTNLQQSRRDKAYYKSTKQVYSALKTETKLDAELAGTYVMKGSLDAVTNSISSSNESVTGLVLKIFDYSMIRTISKRCLNQISLTTQFEGDFKKLPTKIQDPKIANSWSRFNHFISKYGTHMVQAVVYGSSIYAYSFAKSSNKYSQRDFAIKACLGLQGPTQAGQVKVDACAGVTKEDRNRITNFEMNDKVVVRGGTSPTRAALLHKRDEELVTKFLTEGRTTPSPVQYTFVAIWEILKIKYFDTPDYARAKNLEEYFKGFLNYGCELKKVEQVEVQRFELSPHATDDNPTYRCMLMEPGCNVHDDCDYNAGKAGCSCWGSTCIKHTTQKSGDGSERRIPSQGSSWDAMGCGWHWGDATCDCFNKARMLPEWENIKPPRRQIIPNAKREKKQRIST